MMEHPCQNCEARKMLAKRFDIHVFGEDCPYFCIQYEIYTGRWGKNDIEDGE